MQWSRAYTLMYEVALSAVEDYVFRHKETLFFSLNFAMCHAHIH
jgi:hypothetical protein